MTTDDLQTNYAFKQGQDDCILDAVENCPFASVGGLDKRSDMTVPTYVDAEKAASYLEGYRSMAAQHFGEDWATCEFSWRPTFTIESNLEVNDGASP